MRRSALADVLRDLAPGASGQPPLLRADVRGRRDAGPSQEAPADAAAEAYKVGITEGRHAALAEVENLLEEGRVEANERLERERAQWTEAVAQGLEAKLTASLRALEDELFDVVGRCLAPMVRNVASAEALNQVLAGIQDALSVSKDVMVNVEGPERLLEILADRLDKQGIAYRLVPSTGVDVKVQIGSTTIVTKLGELLARFKEFGE